MFFKCNYTNVYVLLHLHLEFLFLRISHYTLGDFWGVCLKSLNVYTFPAFFFIGDGLKMASISFRFYIMFFKWNYTNVYVIFHLHLEY